MTSAFYFAVASAFLFSGGFYDFQYCNNFTFRIVTGRPAEKAGLPSLPGMILAGASVDDVIVIVLFSAFASISAGGSFSLSRFARIPPAIFAGLLAGPAAGYITGRCLTFFTLNKPVQIILPLCAAFVLYSAEDFLTAFIPFSGLIAVMSMGLALQKKAGRKNRSFCLVPGLIYGRWRR